MKIVLQRVTQASVRVGEEVVAQIARGYVARAFDSCAII